MNALSEALRGARRVVFFGGAGVSVPSGIPDFRGENGLYAKEYDGLTAEMLLSHSFSACIRIFFMIFTKSTWCIRKPDRTSFTSGWPRWNARAR
ncbi:MAG: Sir2 family NAD-dependent protein deacetylase [Christensenellales bacterium]